MKHQLLNILRPLQNRKCLLGVVTIQAVSICVLLLLLTISEWRKPPLPYRKDVDFVEPNYTKQALEWMRLPERVKHLNENPIYANFNISRNKNPPHVTLLIIVSSAPKRIERRMAIRETWWQQCKSSEKVTVKCIFMTDNPDTSIEAGQNVLKEKMKYQDIEFQYLQGGVEFGTRYLYHLIWAVQQYDFDYFMRMDDDYFLCLDRLIKELPMPVQTLYHWGYVHCIQDIVRPEESIILFSRDLVEMFLLQDPQVIKGHPWADQMVATWVTELELPKIYNHDPRLHHEPTLLYIKNITTVFKNVCSNFIGVHGSYPKYMKLLWELRGGQEYRGVSLNEYTKVCPYKQSFFWQLFLDVWKYMPKRLITRPVWDTSKQDRGGKFYGGREENKEKVNT